MPLQETPDSINVRLRDEEGALQKVVALDFSHPTAITFCILGVKTGNIVIVASDQSTHPTIYNGLKQCAKVAPKDYKRELKDYNSRVVRGTLTAEILKEYMSDSRKAHGNPRRETFSGRVWKSVKVKDFAEFSAISFWVTADQLKGHSEVIPAVKNAFGLKDPLYFEYVNSKEPILYRDVTYDYEDTFATRLKSRVAPHLTQNEIIDILQRGHSSPHTLTALEKEVLHEFRGRPVPRRETGGYRSPAEFNYRKTIGEAGSVRGFIDLLEGK